MAVATPGGRWIDAVDLRVGHWLETAGGQLVRVTGTHAYTATTHVYNLTITDLHTFYVTTGTTDTLTHNCGPGVESADEVSLYRNVDEAEFAPIAETGRFEPGGGSMEGKWFATTRQHTDQLGDKLNGGRGLTVEIRVPRSLVDGLHQNRSVTVSAQQCLQTQGSLKLSTSWGVE